jgi:hypothetical protein
VSLQELLEVLDLFQLIVSLQELLEVLDLFQLIVSLQKQVLPEFQLIVFQVVSDLFLSMLF